MKNSTIAVLSVIALIVTLFAGLTWYYNNSMVMQNKNMNMTQNPPVTTEVSSTPMPDSMNMNDNMTDKTEATPEATPTINNHEYAKNLIKPKGGQPIKRFTLTAQETSLEIRKGLDRKSTRLNSSH